MVASHRSPQSPQVIDLFADVSFGLQTASQDRFDSFSSSLPPIMTQPNIVELAKQGNAKAIAALINRHLQPKGITAKAALKDGCLQIVLESDQVPNQQTLVTFIRQGITSLEAASIQKVRIYMRQTDEQAPCWIHEFYLTAQHHTYADPLIVDWDLMVEWAIPILLLALAIRPTVCIRSEVTQPTPTSSQELENRILYESIFRVSSFLVLIFFSFIIILIIGQYSTNVVKTPWWLIRLIRRIIK